MARGRQHSWSATHLLDAVADRRELIREVRAAGLGGVEVALDDHADAAAHDAVAVPAAQARLCEARGGASEKAAADVAPSQIEERKRTHPRHALVWNAL